MLDSYSIKARCMNGENFIPEVVAFCDHLIPFIFIT